MPRSTHLLAMVCAATTVVTPSVARGESYWSVQSGVLAAFDVDLATGASKITMQNIAPANAYLLAAAIDPSTGELWASYWTQTSLLGIWEPGVSSLTPRVNVAGLDVFEMAFSESAELYVYAFQGNESFIGTLDRVTGEALRVVEFPAGSYFGGLSFDPISGDLYFHGLDSCDSACVSFVDRLTVPGHVRSRVWSSVDGRLFSSLLVDGSDGSQVLVDVSTYDSGFWRPGAGDFSLLSQLPQLATPLGSLTLRPAAISNISWNYGCWPSRLRACLQKRRFEVEATYDATIFGGTSGFASPNLESDQSLKMSFFDPANLELFLKVIDGCGANGHYWVFASGLTNAGVSLRITDRVRGVVKTYDNPAGQAFVPRLDIEAFACN